MIDTDVPGKSSSPATRYLIMTIVGLILGIVLTVMVLRAWQARQDPFPKALMTVMAKQSAQLKDAQAQNRCTLADTLPRLQTMRALTNDIDAAFPSMRDDARFQEHASALRATLNQALANPPTDCPSLAKLNQSIADNCQACHQDFK